MKVSELIVELNKCQPDATIEASCQTGCHTEEERGHPIWLEILGVVWSEGEGEFDYHVLLTLGEVTMV